MDFNEFHTVRVVCHSCGWFRVIGYTGVKDGVRALVRIRRSAAACNLLDCDIREVPAALARADYAGNLQEFSDLNAEAYKHGLPAVCRQFQPMLEDAVCPRCGQRSNIAVDMYLFVGSDPGAIRIRE